MSWALITISTILSGLITMGVTLLVERVGGLVGGMIAMTPNIAIIGTIGLALQVTSGEMFLSGESAIAVGAFVDGVMLAAWRGAIYFIPGKTPTTRLVQSIVVAALVFIAGNTPVVLFFDGLAPRTKFILSICALFAEVTLGSAMIMWPHHGPKGLNQTRWYVVLFRGALSSLLVFFVVYIGSINPMLSGLLASFPVVSVVSVSTLWVSQSEEVAVGALVPMPLGIAAVIVLPLAADYFVPTFGNAGFVLSYLASIVLCIGPLTFVMRKLALKRWAEAEDKSLPTDKPAYGTFQEGASAVEATEA
eukprot:NODE_1038_length_1148_cov_260.610555_g790_i0.p1 GENE.NODE_1038_length_1148_cov_260.610555_g790_i0~~NODE_1038_length_1148_cov_260.610555_g790_i0.p1  ORF type:complete len:328 (-),score=104.87 NODE_1038_length_1148_cov_260.610555_g790_i0:163-1077(-)